MVLRTARLRRAPGGVKRVQSLAGRLGGALGLAALAAAPATAAPVLASAGINWAAAPVARVALSVGFFQPNPLILRLGQPVRLVFFNDGGRTHDFVTNLFASVASRPGARRGALRVILPPVGSAEYDIVPEKAGTYTLASLMLEPPGGVAPARIVVR